MPRDHRLYLDDIVEAIDRIHSYVEGMDHSRFAADQRTMDAVVRNLEIIGEASRSLSAEIKEAIPQTDWRKIVALRNLLLSSKRLDRMVKRCCCPDASGPSL
jgi:uncharacterized protein with HEPN domain